MSFEKGDTVKVVKRGMSADSKKLFGQTGIVTEVYAGYCILDIEGISPSGIYYKEIEKVEEVRDEMKFAVGESVRVIGETYGWGAVTKGDIGVIKSAGNSSTAYTVTFPNQSRWSGSEACFEKIDSTDKDDAKGDVFEVGDTVKGKQDDFYGVVDRIENQFKVYPVGIWKGSYFSRDNSGWVHVNNLVKTGEIKMADSGCSSNGGEEVMLRDVIVNNFGSGKDCNLVQKHLGKDIKDDFLSALFVSQNKEAILAEAKRLEKVEEKAKEKAC